MAERGNMFHCNLHFHSLQLNPIKETLFFFLNSRSRRYKLNYTGTFSAITGHWRNAGLMLCQRLDDGATINRHCANVSCLLANMGFFFSTGCMSSTQNPRVYMHMTSYLLVPTSSLHTVAYSTYMILAVQSLCTLPVKRKFISETDWQLRWPHLSPYLPRLSPAMDSDTDLSQNVSIIIIMNIPSQNMLMTYKK